MVFMSDSGMKFDEGKINKILVLIDDLNDNDLSLVIDKTIKIRAKRYGDCPNTDTIQLKK